MYTNQSSPKFLASATTIKTLSKFSCKYSMVEDSLQKQKKKKKKKKQKKKNNTGNVHTYLLLFTMNKGLQVRFHSPAKNTKEFA
jgi:hypothetical protein